MPIDRPQRYHYKGLEWEITGTPGVRETKVRLLIAGRWSKILERDIGLRMRAARDLTLTARQKSEGSIDTGQRNLSMRNEGTYFIVGPKPYDRTRLKARRAGREVKRRRRGRPRLSRYYALYSNRTSRTPGWLDDSIHDVSDRLIRVLIQIEQAQAQGQSLTAVLRSRLR